MKDIKREAILNHLLARKTSKIGILKGGGQQSLLHSQNDVVRIELAIKRLEEGQYGLCCNCGTPIDSRRLALIPETPLCISCASENAH
jgi:hypothetical protein